MFKGTFQQDAHELFLHLLGTLEDEEDEYIRRLLKEAEDEKTGKGDRNQDNGANGVDGGNGNGSNSDGGGGKGSDGGVNTSRVGDAAEASDEGIERCPSSSGETSADSATPIGSASSEQSGNGNNETTSTAFNTARSREDSDEAAASDVDTAIVPATTNGTIVEDSSCRPDGPSGKSDSALDSAGGENNAINSADAANLVDTEGEGTIKVTATTPSTADMASSSQMNGASSSINPPTGNENSKAQSSVLPSPEENSEGGQLVVPAIAADSAGPRPNGAPGTHEDGPAECEREPDSSPLPKHKASTMEAAAAGEAGTAPGFDVAAQREEVSIATQKSRSARTDSSASRGKSSNKRCPAVGRGDGGEAYTDDEGETTDEGDQDDDDGSSAEGATIAAAAAAGASEPGEDEAKKHEKQEGEEGVMREEKMRGEKVVPGASATPFPRRSAVIEVFGGSLCSVVTCGSCRARSFSTEPTVCLSLEIPVQKKPASSPAAARKAAAEAKQAEANRKQSGGKQVGLADFELNAKEKRKVIARSVFVRGVGVDTYRISTPSLIDRSSRVSAAVAFFFSALVLLFSRVVES